VCVEKRGPSTRDSGERAFVQCTFPLASLDKRHLKKNERLLVIY